MKKIRKYLALGLGCILPLSLLAGCGGDKGKTDEEPLPTPDTTVAAFSDQAVTLALDGTAAKTPISDTLFGVFLEDINYAGYLLDDNLLQNGSFEAFTGALSKEWKTDGATLTVKDTGGVLAGVEEYAAKGVNAHYAEVNVTAAGGGISTEGPSMLPIAVTKGTNYLFSAFVKSSAAVTMTVKIKDATATYAEKSVELKGHSEWVKYQLTLNANETAASGISFSVSFDGTGTYLIDGIQLETADSTVGIKQYAYDAIKELAPKFIRFPGGCIIEGDGGNGGADTQEVYDWKNSVGAVQNGTKAGEDTIPVFSYTLVKDGTESKAETQGEWITRKQNGDLWGYDMEYGIGFYEYFLLCDSLGASAVPVVNCGWSCMGGGASLPQALNGRHGQKVQDYIQDAVNLIEFAKGDKTTKWGALRAALGHEAPFKMDYIGIGNEQYGNNYYITCYEEFLQNADFKKAISDYSVKPIVGNGMAMADCQNTTKNAAGLDKTPEGTAQKAAKSAVEANVVGSVDDYGVHDHHYYVNWTKLLDNYAMYDNYARPGDPDYYGVFVGEYSANDGDGAVKGYPLYANSLITALAEGAMMTSYERNGDVIKLAAYAPMFGAANTAEKATIGGNDTLNQWDVDMMYYTNTKIVRTANYYVQQLFMKNQGHQVLFNSALTWTADPTFAFPAEDGAAEKSFNKLYFSAMKGTGNELIVKIVNVTGEAVRMNIDITNATSRGFAYCTELAASDYKAVNTLQKEAVAPKSKTIGWEGQSLGYELQPYSLTVLRILTK